MTITCAAYLGVSMDGFIAGPDGDLAWLDATPNPTGSDMGYNDFISSVDAIVMGRGTFETVLGFDVDWPYTIPVIVMSRSRTDIPTEVTNVELTALSPTELVSELDGRGMSKIYIDGGAIVTSFLDAGLLDELTTTSIPVALGSGTPLFGKLSSAVWFDLVSTEVINDALIQTTYRSRR